MLLALLGATAGQAVVWYAGQFYALFFLERVLKVDGLTANLLVAIALAITYFRLREAHEGATQPQPEL